MYASLLYLASISLWRKDPITAITIGIIVWQNHGLYHTFDVLALTDNLQVIGQWRYRSVTNKKIFKICVFCLHIGLAATAARPICTKTTDSPCINRQWPRFIYISLFLTKNFCFQDFLMSLVRRLIGINSSLRQKPNCCMPQFVCKLLFTNYSAIIEHTNQVIFLEDDDVAAVTNGSLTIHRIRRNFDDPNESTVREVISLQMEIQQIMKGTKMILSLLCYKCFFCRIMSAAYFW